MSGSIVSKPDCIYWLKIRRGGFKVSCCEAQRIIFIMQANRVEITENKIMAYVSVSVHLMWAAGWLSFLQLCRLGQLQRCLLCCSVCIGVVCMCVTQKSTAGELQYWEFVSWCFIDCILLAHRFQHWKTRATKLLVLEILMRLCGATLKPWLSILQTMSSSVTAQLPMLRKETMRMHFRMPVRRSRSSLTGAR